MTGSARSGFGIGTTTAEVLEGIDLRGRLALVTGGASDLGTEAAHGQARTANILFAVELEAARRLWSLSEEMAGQAFPL